MRPAAPATPEPLRTSRNTLPRTSGVGEGFGVDSAGVGVGSGAWAEKKSKVKLKPPFSLKYIAQPETLKMRAKITMRVEKKPPPEDFFISLEGRLNLDVSWAAGFIGSSSF